MNKKGFLFSTCLKIKKTWLLLAVSLLITDSILAQQWSGSSTTSGSINREGKVILNSTNWDDHLELSRYGFGGTFRPDHSPGYQGLRLDLLGSGSSFYVLGGYVGIGTSAPSAKLHLKGINAIPTELRIAGANYASNWFSYFNTNGSHPDYSPKLRILEENVPGLSNGFTISAEQYLGVPRYAMGTKDNTPVSILTNDVEHVRITNTGNVGIGTTEPTARLDVNGTAKFSDNLTVANGKRIDIGNIGLGYSSSLESSSGSGLLFPSTTGGLDNPGGYISGAATGPWGSVMSFYVRDAAGSLTKNILSLSGEGSGTIIANGNVCIGTSDPGSFKLAVEGKLGARKVVVTQTVPWPDYVFQPTYKLPSLMEVEAFIKTNKHLPGVPSAKEITEKGLDVGENQALLLKKIEELTLYLIEVNKKVEELKLENSELKKNIKKKNSLECK